MALILDFKDAITIVKLLESINTNGIDYKINSKVTVDDLFVRGISTLSSASAHEISFFTNNKYIDRLIVTKAMVVIIDNKFSLNLSRINNDNIKCFIITNKPQLLYTKIVQWFDNFISKKSRKFSSISSFSIISNNTKIGKNVTIGPYCVIDSDVEIGNGCTINSFSVIESGVKIGNNCKFFSRVTLYKNTIIGDNSIVHSGAVIGSDGFGYAADDISDNFKWSKIPHLGSVVIGNNVEIGANTTIDRGSLDNTVISDGVKIDNQVMIAHNVSIGENTVIAACVGIAGSTIIGKRCIIGGASMISGHLHISDDVHIAGGTAIISNIINPGKYAGVFPYSKHKDWQKNAPVILHLAKLRKLVKFPNNDN